VEATEKKTTLGNDTWKKAGGIFIIIVLSSRPARFAFTNEV